jgi:gamma-F420-2:alpha-L-glutamate ligase
MFQRITGAVMLGWVIYRVSQDSLNPEMYEINRLIEEAKRHRIELRILQPEQIDLIVTQEDRKSILVDGKTQPLPDFVLPRMGAGTTYFALAVIRHLERLGVPCFNTSYSIDVVKDKLFTQQMLAEKNLPVPKTMLVKFPIDLDLIQRKLGFPLIIKTLSGSQGKGVFLSENKKSLADLMHMIELLIPRRASSSRNSSRTATVGICGFSPWEGGPSRVWSVRLRIMISRRTFLPAGP